MRLYFTFFLSYHSYLWLKFNWKWYYLVDTFLDQLPSKKKGRLIVKKHKEGRIFWLKDVIQKIIIEKRNLFFQLENDILILDYEMTICDPYSHLENDIVSTEYELINGSFSEVGSDCYNLINCVWKIGLSATFCFSNFRLYVIYISLEGKPTINMACEQYLFHIESAQNRFTFNQKGQFIHSSYEGPLDKAYHFSCWFDKMQELKSIFSFRNGTRKLTFNRGLIENAIYCFFHKKTKPQMDLLLLSSSSLF
jgi:hypothetical protein